MAIARAQATSGTNATGGTNTTATTAFGSPITAGNFIIVGIVQEGSSTSVTDTFNNPYRLIWRQKRTSLVVEVWLAEVVAAGASNVVTATQGFTDGAIFAEEWSGLAYHGIDRIATGQSASGTSTISTAASSVTQSNSELVFVVGENDIAGTTNMTVGSGYSNFVTARSSFVVGATQSLVQSSATAQTGTMGLDNTNGWILVLVTFSSTSTKPSIQVNNLRPHAFSPGLAR